MDTFEKFVAAAFALAVFVGGALGIAAAVNRGPNTAGPGVVDPATPPQLDTRPNWPIPVLGPDPDVYGPGPNNNNNNCPGPNCPQ